MIFLSLSVLTKHRARTNNQTIIYARFRPLDTIYLNQ